MHPYVALTGDSLVALGWLEIFYVFRENTFTAAIIEVAPDHKVISTGPYVLVRHPMYAGALVMFVGVPIALGSWWGSLVVAAMLPALLWRLLDEEEFLAKNLPGYAAYQQTVRYRLIRESGSALGLAAEAEPGILDGAMDGIGARPSTVTWPAARSTFTIAAGAAALMAFVTALAQPPQVMPLTR